MVNVQIGFNLSTDLLENKHYSTHETLYLTVLSHYLTLLIHGLMNADFDDQYYNTQPHASKEHPEQ